jgi:hypothetical protein
VKTTEIRAQSGAAFDEDETAMVEDIVLDQTYQAVSELLTKLTLFQSDGTTPLIDTKQARRKIMRSHLAVFYNRFLDGTVAKTGTTDFDNMRDKNELRERVRRLLGLPPIVPDQEQWLVRRNKKSQSVPITYTP